MRTKRIRKGVFRKNEGNSGEERVFPERRKIIPQETIQVFHILKYYRVKRR